MHTFGFFSLHATLQAQQKRTLKSFCLISYIDFLTYISIRRRGGWCHSWSGLPHMCSHVVIVIVTHEIQSVNGVWRLDEGINRKNRAAPCRRRLPFPQSPAALTSPSSRRFSVLWIKHTSSSATADSLQWGASDLLTSAALVGGVSCGGCTQREVAFRRQPNWRSDFRINWNKLN